MAKRSVPAPSCPQNHTDGQIHAVGVRQTKQGEARRFRCQRWQAGVLLTHKFTVAPKTRLGPRQLIDQAVPVPACQVLGHEDRLVSPYGTYETLAGTRQRYQCVDMNERARAAGARTDASRRRLLREAKHTFSDVLPRSAVEDDTCCADCRVLTPKNAGSEAPTRRTNYPVSVICSVLRDLSQGMAYTHASLRALELMRRSTGRVRMVAGKAPEELNANGDASPHREAKAHWHVAADILERYGPVVTEEAFARVRADEATYRAAGLPVVYLADEVPVKRDFARSTRLTASPVVWSALVVARTRWHLDDEGTMTGRSSRLLRVRALPTSSVEAWTLVFSELDPPDFLVADGSSSIAKAGQTVWGRRTVFVPCMHHAVANVMKNLTARRTELPEKVRDHQYLLTRSWLQDDGAGAVKEWFDELERLAAASGIPADVVAAQRRTYQPLLLRTAQIATAHNSPPVPLSNSGVEAEILAWVSKVTTRRGAMFTNLPRTNLLGDLVVTGSAGLLTDTHRLATLIRDASRRQQGWAPPPRALAEPAGVMALRDPMSVAALLKLAGT